MPKLKLKHETALKETTLNIIELCIQEIKKLKQPDFSDPDLIESIFKMLNESIEETYTEKDDLTKAQAKTLDKEELMIMIVKEAFQLYDERDIKQIQKQVQHTIRKYKSFKKKFIRKSSKLVRTLSRAALGIA